MVAAASLIGSLPRTLQSLFDQLGWRAAGVVLDPRRRDALTRGRAADIRDWLGHAGLDRPGVVLCVHLADALLGAGQLGRVGRVGHLVLVDVGQLLHMVSNVIAP